jgi:hypothetical protein
MTKINNIIIFLNELLLFSKKQIPKRQDILRIQYMIQDKIETVSVQIIFYNLTFSREALFRVVLTQTTEAY